MAHISLCFIAGLACSTILSPSLLAQRIYVDNYYTSWPNQDWISVVDVGAATVMATMRGSAVGMVFSADGTLAWTVADNRVRELDTKTFRFTRTSSQASPSYGPTYYSGLVLNHRTNRLHRTRDADRGVLLTLDAATLTNLPEVKLGRCPSNLVLSADEANGYVLDRSTGELQVLDALALSVKAKVPLTTPAPDYYSCGKDRVAISRDGRRIYVSNFRLNEILALDSLTLAVIERIAVVGRFAGDFTISRDDRYLYVRQVDPLTVWDTLTRRWIRTLPPVYGPIALGNDGNLIWMSGGGGGGILNPPSTLRAFETTNFTQVAEISIPHTVDTIVMAPDNIPLCEATATPLNDRVRVTRSGFRYNYGSRKFTQTLSVTNISGVPIVGMLSVVLRGLTAGAKPSSPIGSTVCRAPAGDPYVWLPDSWPAPWPANETRTIVLEFVNPTMGAINYSTEVLGDGNH